MKKLPIKKSFEKDETAQQIIRLMMDEKFADMPDIYKAETLGISLQEYEKYINDPSFLRYAVKTMQDLFIAKLPKVLNTIYQQALEGKGRQQKMLLEFMKISNDDKETKSPNIIIVNNIPNPDDLVNQRKIVNLEEISNGGTSSLQ